jgi:hypothetical protein
MPPTCLFGKSMHMPPLITFCPSAGTGAAFTRSNIVDLRGSSLIGVPLTNVTCRVCPRTTFSQGTVASLSDLRAVPNNPLPPLELTSAFIGFRQLSDAIADAIGDARTTPTPCTSCGPRMTTVSTGSQSPLKCGAHAQTHQRSLA